MQSSVKNNSTLSSHKEGCTCSKRGIARVWNWPAQCRNSHNARQNTNWFNWLVESRTDCTRSTNGALLLLLLLLLLLVVVVVVVVVVDGWLVGWLVGLVFNLIFSSYSVYILRQHVFVCLIMTMTPNPKDPTHHGASPPGLSCHRSVPSLAWRKTPLACCTQTPSALPTPTTTRNSRGSGEATLDKACHRLSRRWWLPSKSYRYGF